MPKYYFDLIDGGTATRDEFGIDLADDDEARDQAIALLPDMAHHEMPDGDDHEFVASARNEKGEIVYEGSLAFHGTWRPGQRG